MEERIKCIVVDDEQPALKLMATYISKEPILEMTGQFKTPVKAMPFLMENKVDILFCDIQMPEISGLNLVRTMPKKPIVIFTTAFSEHASEAFELNAVDYLQKPFSFERFLQAVTKAKDLLRLSALDTAVANNKEIQKDFITIRVDHKIVKIKFDELLFIEGLHEYVKVVTLTANYITFERLKNIELLLPADRFIRVHRSYILAKDKVRSLKGNLLEIATFEIPVSRELKDKIVAILF